MIETLALAAALELAAPRRDEPILLDSRCEAAEWANAAVTPLEGGVTLLAQHDGAFVYLCLRLPQGSFGSLDLHLQSGVTEPVNLHVSAQVGERTRAVGAWPDWRFGNHQGWFGPPVPFGGVRTGADGKSEVRFRDSEARELQLSKARFGPGPWRVRVALDALGPNQDGKTVWPAASSENDPAGWATLRLVG